ncbi:MAG: glycosyltransferase [Geobacteraceae bacterium]|nr:glycosyltransferase [Geobacteraceae bacterium]NTW79754.1 glycosyltransferase [Geobacteraceae bacterium]
MIKIAFIIDTIESPTAGTEKQLLMLIKHLDRSKFQSYLCVLRNSEWLRQDFDECELVDIGVPSFAKPSSYLNIYKFISFLKNQKIDIVQTHFVEGNKVGVISGKLSGVKSIISTRRNQGYWHNKFEIMILNTLNKWVTRFLANSENTRLWAANTENINLDRIEVIHNALEIVHYWKGIDEQRLAFRKNIGFPAEAIIVGIVANLRPVKAIDMFIRSAKIISESCPLVRFVVVGEGTERLFLEQLCTEFGIAARISFLGERMDIPEILSCIDIGVLSSSSESFSNSIIEYMAAGLPVVCTDVGGAREAVVDDINGYIVESGDFNAMADKILSVISSGKMRSFGLNSRENADKLFSLPSIMQRYSQFYEQVVKL